MFPDFKKITRYILIISLVIGGCFSKRNVITTQPLNVLLITLDTCRYDVLGCYEKGFAAKTPVIDRLAERGILFENTYCQAPSTLPSHASILTGQSPLVHGVHDNGIYFLGPEFTTLAEVLSNQGYATAAFVGAYVLDHRFGLSQGFDKYDDEMEDPLRSGDAPDFTKIPVTQESLWYSRFFQPYQRSADRVGQRAIQWINELPSKPFFLWIHFFDPHQPYTPPSEWVKHYDPDYTGSVNGSGPDFLREMREGKRDRRDLIHMQNRYRGEVSFTDEWIGNIIVALKKRNLIENTVVAIMGDHGEGFGEHGLFFEHNALLFDELVRVPFILCPPGNEYEGHRITTPVRTIDLYPTLLEYLDVPNTFPTEGKSLVTIIKNENSRKFPSYFQALKGRQAFPSPVELQGIQFDRWKLISNKHHESGETFYQLFDLLSEPRELNDISADQDSMLNVLRDTLDRIVFEARELSPGIEHYLELDEGVTEKLQSLGYMQ